MYGTRQHICAQLEEGFSADTPLAFLIWTADDMAAFAEGWDLSLNDEEVKAVLAKIGAIDDHHLNGVGADLAGNLLNDVKDEMQQVTLPASLLTRVVTLSMPIWGPSALSTANSCSALLNKSCLMRQAISLIWRCKPRYQKSNRPKTFCRS